MGDMRPETMLQLLLSPSEQARELQSTLTTVSGLPGNIEVCQAPIPNTHVKVLTGHT